MRTWYRVAHDGTLGLRMVHHATPQYVYFGWESRDGERRVEYNDEQIWFEDYDEALKVAIIRTAASIDRQIERLGYAEHRMEYLKQEVAKRIDDLSCSE